MTHVLECFRPVYALNDIPPIASKWNARYAYAKRDQALPEPASVLVTGEAYLPDNGQALDVACGRGANAFYLSQKGLNVQAWDISQVAIDSMLDYKRAHQQHTNVRPEVRNVVERPPTPDSFDVIVVSRFLDRPLCAKLSAALKSGGVLFYQTFTAGLSNRDYLLRPNELPELFAVLEPCLSYESPLDERGFSEAFFVGRKR